MHGPMNVKVKFYITGQKILAGSCELDNELPDSIKFSEFLTK